MPSRAYHDSHFFKVPPEPRLIIYELCIASHGPARIRRDMQPPLLKVCKFVRAEAMETYHKHLQGIVREAGIFADKQTSSLVNTNLHHMPLLHRAYYNRCMDEANGRFYVLRNLLWDVADKLEADEFAAVGSRAHVVEEVPLGA